MRLAERGTRCCVRDVLKKEKGLVQLKIVNLKLFQLCFWLFRVEFMSVSAKGSEYFLVIEFCISILAS